MLGLSPSRPRPGHWGHSRRGSGSRLPHRHSAMPRREFRARPFWRRLWPEFFVDRSRFPPAAGDEASRAGPIAAFPRPTDHRDTDLQMELQGGERWTRTLGWAWVRRSAPNTLAEADPRPGTGADVGAPQAARRAPLAEGRGSGAGLARTRGDGRRAERAVVLNLMMRSTVVSRPARQHPDHAGLDSANIASKLLQQLAVARSSARCWSGCPSRSRSCR